MDNLELLNGFGGNAYAGNGFASESLPQFTFADVIFNLDATLGNVTLSSDVTLPVSTFDCASTLDSIALSSSVYAYATGDLSVTLSDISFVSDVYAYAGLDFSVTLNNVQLESSTVAFAGLSLNETLDALTLSSIGLSFYKPSKVLTYAVNSVPSFTVEHTVPTFFVINNLPTFEDG